MKERSSGLWNEVRAESSCTRRKDCGWFEEEQTTDIQWFSHTSHLVQFQTAGSTTHKYDNLRHGHDLVTIVNSAQTTVSRSRDA